MRSSKRSLAGIAAVALGAALIPFVGTGVSQGAVSGQAATLTVGVPSYTIVTDNWDDSNGLPLIISAFDASGEQFGAADTVGANREVRLTVTNPSTVAASATVLTTTGGGTNVAGLALATATVEPAAGADWSTINPASLELGTYTVNVSLINTLNGAVLSSSSVPITITSAGGANPPTITPVNDAWNPIGALGAERGGTPGNLLWAMRNSTGGPFLTTLDTDDSLAVTAAQSTVVFTNASNAAFNTTGIYSTDYSSGTWTSTRSNDSMTAVYYDEGVVAATGTLPVALSNLPDASGDLDIELTTTPSGEGTGGVDAVVPTGTSALAFDLGYVNALAGTVYWNATVFNPANPGSVAPTAVSVPAGGTVATNAQGNATLSVTVNAAASAEGNTFVLIAQGESFVIEFQDPVATPVAGPALAKISSAAELPGSITDQFGRPIAGTWTATLRPSGVACNATAAPLATAVADAAGDFTLAVPASVAPAVASNVNFTVCLTLGGGTFVTTTGTVEYTATGGVTVLDITRDTPLGIPVVSTPRTGYVALDDTSTQNTVSRPADADPNLAGTFPKFDIAVTSQPAALITVKTTEGAYVSTRISGTVAWTIGKSSVTVPSSTPLAVWATKPGTHTITATVGTTTETFVFVAGVPANAGRQIKAGVDRITVGLEQSFALTASVTDIYGNPVPDALVTPATAGAVFSGAIGLTNAEGVYSSFFLADKIAGPGTVSFFLDEWVSAESAIPGSPSLIRVATTDVTVDRVIATKTILIVGERATVNGKPGIRVEGDTVGFADGAKVKPWVRFPGQTDYTVGSARPTVDAAGDFTWQRKTGKKTYVFFTSDDDVTKSNRVIIPAK